MPECSSWIRRAQRQEKSGYPLRFRTAYVLIEAADGYQVVFSIPEIHPDLGGSRVLVVDRVDGQPLEEDSRPYRIIIANSKLYEVWIRQVTRILVRSATKPTNPTARPGTSGSMPQGPDGSTLWEQGRAIPS